METIMICFFIQKYAKRNVYYTVPQNPGDARYDEDEQNFDYVYSIVIWIKILCLYYNCCCHLYLIFKNMFSFYILNDSLSLQNVHFINYNVKIIEIKI